MKGFDLFSYQSFLEVIHIDKGLTAPERNFTFYNIFVPKFEESELKRREIRDWKGVRKV